MLKYTLLKSIIIIITACLLFFQGCATTNIGLKNAQRFENVIELYNNDPLPEKEYKIIEIVGSGSFISGQVWKQGGNLDSSYVILQLDENRVVEFSFIRGKVLGFEQGNPFGISGFASPNYSSDYTTILTIKLSLKYKGLILCHSLNMEI